MKTPRTTIGLCSAAFVLFVFACVTINIYFPAEKVESVAGEIVEDIRGPSGSQGEAPAGDQSSFLNRALAALSTAPAWAEEATTVSNPTIRALKERMRNRYASMKPFYQNGLLAEGDNGLVSVKGTQGLGLKEQRDLNNLVSAENKDRQALYREVAKALNIDPSQVDRVAEIFAKEWQKSVR
jgi:hypothetical protein